MNKRNLSNLIIKNLLYLNELSSSDTEIQSVFTSICKKSNYKKKLINFLEMKPKFTFNNSSSPCFIFYKNNPFTMKKP